MNLKFRIPVDSTVTERSVVNVLCVGGGCNSESSSLFRAVPYGLLHSCPTLFDVDHHIFTYADSSMDLEQGTIQSSHDNCAIYHANAFWRLLYAEDIYG
ncbi:hypothetical protein BPOR_0273g00100 [Botrytis porri]|uniref:Uncharacterized protein n=1 Tax=Botrytis porri TaxID=87229 RepID=A0A4Z1KL85_9HELO|nr:hypothetical protein BPOR_0273g00100 [Botrytis porri]